MTQVCSVFVGPSNLSAKVSSGFFCLLIVHAFFVCSVFFWAEFKLIFSILEMIELSFCAYDDGDTCCEDLSPLVMTLIVLVLEISTILLER